MGFWGKIRDRMIETRGAGEANIIMTAEEAKELDAALAESMAADRLASTQYEKDIGLDKLQKLLGAPDKPTEWTDSKS